MTNELKPCPFCGEKACIEVFNGHMNFPKFRVECSTCEVNLRLKQTRDEAIEAWNTRQPAFDWKPIEELTEDILRRVSNVLLFHRKGYPCLFDVRYDYNGGVHLNILHEDEEDLQNIRKDYTHYALLTPPQTNQS